MSCEKEIRSLRKELEWGRKVLLSNSDFKTVIFEMRLSHSGKRLVFSSYKDQKSESTLLILRHCFCLLWKIYLLKFLASILWCTGQTKKKKAFWIKYLKKNNVTGCSICFYSSLRHVLVKKPNRGISQSFVVSPLLYIARF